MRRFRLILCSALCALSTIAYAEQRVALVIGNAAYKHAVHLRTPVRDTEAVAKALRDVGFQSVDVETDLGRKDMVAALRRFSEKADGADWALVYYTGHGVETDGVNYLIPVDNDLISPREVKEDALPLSTFLDNLKNVRKLRVVVINASRDFPFVGVPGETKSLARPVGPRPFQPDDTQVGSVIAFSVGPGGVPLDGEPTSAMSPYAAAFVKALATPDLDITKVFFKVREDVLKTTDRRQEPTTYESLQAESYIIHPLMPPTRKK